MGFYGLQEIEFEWWLLCCTLQLPKTRNTGNILHQRKTAVFEILCSFLGCWLVRNNKRLWTSVGVITGCVWSVTHLFWCRFTRLCHIFIRRISAVRADYWCGPMGAVVFEGFSWSYLFSSLASKSKCVIFSSMCIHLTKKKARKPQQNFPLKYVSEARWLKGAGDDGICTFFSFFSCFFVHGWRGFAVIGLTHSSHFEVSCPPPCQQSHSCGRWSEKKNYLRLLFFFFFLSFLLSSLRKGWMNFQFSCMLVSFLLLLSSSTCWPALRCWAWHCTHTHTWEKTALPTWGHEKQSGFPSIRRDYVTKLKFEMNAGVFIKCQCGLSSHGLHLIFKTCVLFT